MSDTGTATFVAERLIPLAGYGVNLKTMFRVGAWLTALIWALLAVTGYLAARFWPGFGVA